MHKTLSDVLSSTLKPLCPRDSHAMHYEAKGIHWKNDSGDTESMPSYHCGYLGCSVRYTHEQGYFTVGKTPEEPYLSKNPQPISYNVLDMALCCIVAGMKRKTIFIGAVASKTASTPTLTYPACGSASEFYMPEEISLTWGLWV